MLTIIKVECEYLLVVMADRFPLPAATDHRGSLPPALSCWVREALWFDHGAPSPSPKTRVRQRPALTEKLLIAREDIPDELSTKTLLHHS
jgi:hypothetical protein